MRRQSEWQLEGSHLTLENPEFSAKEHRCSHLWQQPEASCQHISPFQEKNRHKYQIDAKFSLRWLLFPISLFGPTRPFLYCPPRISSSPSAHAFHDDPPEGLKVACAHQKPTLLYIQQPPQGPYHNITLHSGRGVLSPEAINLSLWGEYNPPGFKAKQTQGWRVSNVITPLKLPAALKPSPQFNPGFFRVEYAANGRSCQGKGWEIKGFIKIGSCDGFFCMLFQQTGMKEPYHIKSSGREPGSRVNHVRWPERPPVLGAYQCTVI